MSVRSMSTFVDGAKSWIIYSRILRIYRFPGGGGGGVGISLTMAAPPRTWQRRSHEQNSKSARAFETFLHFVAVLCKSSTSTLQNFF